MTGRRKCRELSQTCRDDPDGQLRGAPSPPAGQNNESETGAPRPREASADKSPAAAERKIVSNMAIAVVKEMGLCATCENRETCTFPNAGKNIHLCEEYQ